jgi:tetratricopeptide (TPR) repeat protein
MDFHDSRLEYEKNKMNLAESPHYLLFIDAILKKDFDAAKAALLVCLNMPEFKEDPFDHVDILQTLGDVCFQEGDVEKALEYYRESEEINPNEVQDKYFFAKFLAEKIKDTSAAIAKCDQIIALAKKNPFPKIGDGYGSEDFIEKAEVLKKSLLNGQNII